MSYDCGTNGSFLDGTFSTPHALPLTLLMWGKATASQWALIAADFGVWLGADLTSLNSSIRLTKTDGAADRVTATTRSSSSSDSDAHLDFTPGDYDNVWVMMVATFTSASRRDAYIENSSITASSTATRDPGSLLDSIRIGANSSGFNVWKTLLAEVAIFDKVLSAAEIDAGQTAAETGVIPSTIAPVNCIGYWSLDSDQATHADQSGNGGPTLTVTNALFDADHPNIASAGVINTKTLSDSMDIVDPSQVTHRARRPGDTIADMTDAVFIKSVLGRLIIDTFTVSDADAIMLEIARRVSDTVTLSDATLTMRKCFRELSDVITTIDAFNVVMTIGRIKSTGIALTDIELAHYARGKILLDSLGLVDNFEKIITIGETQQIFVKVLGELINIDDTQTSFRSGVIVSNVVDTLAVNEFIDITLFRRRLMLDDFGMLDDLLFQRVRYQLDSGDALSTGDAIESVRRCNRQAVNNLSLADNQDSISIRVRSLFTHFDEDLVEQDENVVVVTDDIVVTRSAIINSVVRLDLVFLSEFLAFEAGSFLPEGVPIETDIDQLNIGTHVCTLDIETDIV